MGKKRWTTPEQRAWLEERIPAFLEAQKLQTVRQFLIETFGKWQSEWPSLELTAEELRRARGNKERALSVQRKALEDVRTYNKSSR
jgi:hypothetical protein